MTYFAKASRIIVVKASRETIGLVAVASAMTFMLAYAVHSRPTPPAPTTPPVAVVQQDWAGQLAELQSAPAAPDPALTSADLVVPKAQLALPAMPMRPIAKRGCDDPSCLKVPVPPPRRVVAVVPPTVSATIPSGEPKRTLLSNLNPLNHLPPMSTVSKPFTYAGDVVSGWIKRF